MDSIDDLQDESWSHAYTIVRSTARIPVNLPHLMRACWNDLVSPAEFVRLLAIPGLPLRSLYRAAKLPQVSESIKQPELVNAVNILGVKASALILAINCICERTLDSGPATRVWTPLFKEMMSEIEIGYHLGLSLEGVGHEQGMLVGFSRLAGLALLLIKDQKAFAEWHEQTDGDPTHRRETSLAFGCEPYQISSILMQHLGLGTEVALATASTLAGGDFTIIEAQPSIQTWRGTYHWLHALKNGDLFPSCAIARATFSELCRPHEDLDRIPDHLAMLQEQVAAVREAQSLWTWHLPYDTYEETAKAIVYRVNSNENGTIWTKGLVQPGRS
jgi:hypothetical protein